MRRRVLPVLALALACGRTVTSDPAPLDTFYKPSGLAWHGGNLIVASSNFDLRYRLEDGGTIVSVNPRATVNPQDAKLVSGVRIGSYSGELAVADATECGLAGSVAVVAERSTASLYAAAIGADGSLGCDGCAVSLGVGLYADPLAVGVACANGWARAYVAYLRSYDGRGWISEYDLAGHTLRSGEVAYGPVRGFAFDSQRQRLWMTALTTGGPSFLTWLDLASGCRIDIPQASGGCTRSTIAASQLPPGLELRSIALSSAGSNPVPGVRRAYVTGRLYDTASAATAGGRTIDYGGELLVLDLVEGSTGGVDAFVVREIPLGTGAAEVKLLPPRTGKRDVVAALDGTSLTIYDDDSGAVRTFGTDPSTGAPVLGHVPWGIAVEPPPTGGTRARLYVGSFQDSFVTPIDVPMGAPETACMVSASGACATASDPPARIQGGRP